MEKYIGLSVDTINKMRDEYVLALGDAIRENAQFPKDGCIYKRVKRLATEIGDLTNELEFRHDEIIEG